MEIAPLFRIQGPDEDGNVWILVEESGKLCRRNLGPCEAEASVMAEWLGQVDCGS